MQIYENPCLVQRQMKVQEIGNFMLTRGVFNFQV